MLKQTMSLTAMLVFAGCAAQKPSAALEDPAPVEITESAPAPAAPETDSDASANPDAPQKPAQTDTGRFRISVASVDKAEIAEPWVRKAEAAGYRTELLEVTIDGRTWHRVLLPGYASLADAQAALPFVQQDLGAPGAWVTSRRRAPTPDGAPTAAPAAPAPDVPAPPAPEQPAN